MLTADLASDGHAPRARPRARRRARSAWAHRRSRRRASCRPTASRPRASTLRIVDARGVPVRARTLVTLESTLGRLAGEDLDPWPAACRSRSRAATRRCRCSRRARRAWPRSVQRRATSRVWRASCSCPTCGRSSRWARSRARSRCRRVSPAGAACWRDRGPRSRRPWARSPPTGDGGDQFAGVRGALFVKGRVKDDVLLTLGYDSDRPKDLRRLRDIQPDALLPALRRRVGKGLRGALDREPVRAPRSPRRVAALRRLTTRLSRGRAPGARLAAYSRSLSGLAASYETHGAARQRLDEQGPHAAQGRRDARPRRVGPVHAERRAVRREHRARRDRRARPRPARARAHGERAAALRRLRDRPEHGRPAHEGARAERRRRPEPRLPARHLRGRCGRRSVLGDRPRRARARHGRARVGRQPTSTTTTRSRARNCAASLRRRSLRPAPRSRARSRRRAMRSTARTATRRASSGGTWRRASRRVCTARARARTSTMRRPGLRPGARRAARGFRSRCRQGAACSSTASTPRRPRGTRARAGSCLLSTDD